MVKTLKILIISLCWLSIPAQAQGAKTPYWMSQKYQASMGYLLRNISPEGAKKGVVIASPSKQRPNYYFHWIRDAALVMNPIIDLYIMSKSSREKERWEKMLIEFAVFSRANQLTKTMTGLGEPKFNVDGTGFNGPWGRPQFDGPALRAAVLARFAGVLIQYGREDIVRKYLWDPKKPKESVIKTDLDFVAKVMNQPSFDIWEELKGIHFFTVMAQRKAFLIGAKLANRLGQHRDAEKYRRAYLSLTTVMERFWDSYRSVYVGTARRTGGIDYKKSNLDSSIFIAANFSEFTDLSVGSINDPRMLRMFFVLESTFGKLYWVNKAYEKAPLIGRYPEDRYDGEKSTVGNPWFLTTHAFAEFLYKFSATLTLKGEIEINAMTYDFYETLEVDIKKKEIIKKKDKRFAKILENLQKKADLYLANAQKHSPVNFRMTEQINRSSGVRQGAIDLTWSYSSYITAYFARHRFNAYARNIRY